ncbi:Extracellular protein 53-1 [Teratosphaeria destructans]|uniref:Extracellular protein 53-1 n=1 Tax=Teratosphaeria destructans TaxID=418781 RepID=A0A9W7W5U1_9PEZI|nr:Extracellular protein 53-1 [Teratosphaeria destructans]
MKVSTATFALGLLSMTQAVDMKDYSPTAEVDTGFKAYLRALYASAEDSTATTSFTDYFPPDGQLIVLSNVATGSAEIIALKQRLLPPNGNKHWNHVPIDASVDAETKDFKRYQVLGKIQTTFDGLNCSQAVYKTRFTVAKKHGVLSFAPHSGNLIKYDDFYVHPDKAPTNIPCDP